MGEMENVAKSIIRNLSDFNRETLFKLHKAGKLEYDIDEDSDNHKDNYKDLRNMGLVRTRNRQAMRKDNTILLTQLGVLIVGEIHKNT